METTVFYNQYEKLKMNLYIDIQSEMNKLKEKIDFFNIRYFVDDNNPDRICMIHGLDNNNILVDSAVFGLEALKLNEMNLDNLLFIKEQIDLYHKNKLISSLT